MTFSGYRTCGLLNYLSKVNLKKRLVPRARFAICSILKSLHFLRVIFLPKVVRHGQRTYIQIGQKLMLKDCGTQPYSTLDQDRRLYCSILFSLSSFSPSPYLRLFQLCLPQHSRYLKSSCHPSRTFFLSSPFPSVRLKLII